MNIKPIASPAAMQQGQSNGSAAQQAKARAVAILTGEGQSQVVQNQNAVAPEEMRAIQASTQQAAPAEEQAVEEQQVVETTPEVPKPQQDPALSRQFAQLAKQEKALRAKALQQEQSFKAREEALKAKEAALQQEPKQDLSNYISKDRFKSDPLSVIAETGMSYDEIVNQLINQPAAIDPRVDSTIKQLQAEIQSLKQQNEQSKKAAEEQQSNTYKAAIQQITTDTKALVMADPQFETIKATNSIRDVVELIEQTYHKDGIILSVEEAAQQVEDYLVEEAIKLAKIGKVQKRLQPVAPAAAASTVQRPVQTTQKQVQPMKTLTNTTSSTRQLSARERALLAFRGEKP